MGKSMLITTRLICAACLSVLAAAYLIPTDSQAIPAFARKYRLSCTACHAPVPRLKEFGEDFAGNAFSLEGQEPKRFFPDTGDDMLTLQRELPIAVRLDAYMQYSHSSGKKRSDLKTPYGLKLLSGGNISDRIGYYFYFYMSERGEVAGVEDAYVHFNNLFGVDLDIMAGQFQISDPLFKRELRLTLEDYVIYTVRVGDSPTNLTYDRGFMLTYGADFGLSAAFQIVNGNGKGEPEDGMFDEDSWKNFFFRLSQPIGPVRIGGFGYLCNSVKNKSGIDVRNRHYYWGVDGTIDLGGNLQFNGQYLERVDDNPFFAVGPGHEDVTTTGGIAELIWFPTGDAGRHWIVMLYNNVDSNVMSLNYRTETGAYNYLLRRNLRLIAEATFSEIEESWRFTGGLVSAF